jgi:hypothetical protein
MLRVPCARRKTGVPPTPAFFAEGGSGTDLMVAVGLEPTTFGL